MMTAHIFDGGTAPTLWLIVAAIIVALIVIEHRVVRGVGSPMRHGVAGLIAGALILGGGLVLAPISGAGQATDGLPDLISDAPRPAFLKEIVDERGDRRLVVTFDGYVHNIGDGPLHVVGNPQVPDGMVQQVREGGEWRDVATPTIRYETDDGHNHFHLIEAVDYVLWNQAQGTQTAAGSKIGFCLVDSEQMEPGTDQAYSEELDNFCEEDNPSATSLRMGISSGWRDIYDATTTLQWVDISELAPGRYWIGAITDPNDEIVESDETNNDLIFSNRPAIVPGWMPADAATVAVGQTEIELTATAFGTVGQPIFTIEQGPTAGVLDVPTGASITSPIVRYTPDPDASGNDEFVFSVRDRSSAYPLEATTATVTIGIESSGTAAASPGEPPSVLPETTFFEMNEGEPFSTTVAVSAASGGAVRLFATGLPLGLAIEGDRIAGTAVRPGFTDIELVAIDETGATATQTVTLIVNEAAPAALGDVADRMSPLMEPVRERIGPSVLGATYEAGGLPPGLAIDEAAAIIAGRPTEVGAFEVEVTETSPDGETVTTRFDWTIRPAIAISFAL